MRKNKEEEENRAIEKTVLPNNDLKINVDIISKILLKNEQTKEVRFPSTVKSNVYNFLLGYYFYQ